MTESRDGFYIIYECDLHESRDSIIVKAILTDEDEAIAHYARIESAYLASDDGEGWQLRLGYLPKDHDKQSDGDILRQMEDVTPIIWSPTEVIKWHPAIAE